MIDIYIHTSSICLPEYEYLASLTSNILISLHADVRDAVTCNYVCDRKLTYKRYKALHVTS